MILFVKRAKPFAVAIFGNDYAFYDHDVLYRIAGHNIKRMTENPEPIPDGPCR